ncbi:MAG: hypothetical protein M0018_06755 [Nitrospiraceae bacterium]|nr:hypothetical protein [Nitrospiraceae bacterium]
MWWQYGIGYLFSVVIGHFLIYPLVDSLWNNLGWQRRPEGDLVRPVPEHHAMVGMLERGLYTSALLMGKMEFIGLWFFIKVAGNWKGFSEDREFDGVKIHGRSIFNIALIANGFSIAYGVLGGMIVNWLNAEQYDLAFGASAILVVVTAGFWLWSRQRRG